MANAPLIVRRIPLKDISAIPAANTAGTAIIKLPVGPRYRAVFFCLGNTARGDINPPLASDVVGEIRAYFNTSIQRRVTAARLDAINAGMSGAVSTEFQSQGFAGTANGGGRLYLPMYFAEPWRMRTQDADALAWQTGWLGTAGTFQIELDIKSTCTAALTAFALVDNVSTGQPNGIMKWYTRDYNANAATTTVTDFQRKDVNSQWNVFNTSDGKNITAAVLKVDGIERHNLSNTDNPAQLVCGDMNPAASNALAANYPIVFDRDDQLADCLDISGSTEVTLDLTWNAAANGTFSIVSQRLGLPD